jgi:hypothetical protein
MPGGNVGGCMWVRAAIGIAGVADVLPCSWIATGVACFTWGIADCWAGRGAQQVLISGVWLMWRQQACADW